MRAIRRALTYRLSNESLDTRLGQLACYLGSAAIVPIAALAPVRHPGSRADLLFGLALACLVSLLLAMLGTLCRREKSFRHRLPFRFRWPELASYAACVGLLVMGLRGLAGLALTPAQVTLGVLTTSALSLAVLVLGMMTTLVRSLKR